MTSNINAVSFGTRIVNFAESSITDLPRRYDAIVVSDDNYLSHGGGVSRELWSAAGPTLVAEIAQGKPALRLGDVHTTGAGNLNAKYLLHAITIDFDANTRISSINSISLVRATLTTAEKLGCKNIAIPLLGTGAAGLRKEDFVQTFAQAVRIWAIGPSSLSEVCLVVLPSEAYLLSAAKEGVHSIVSCEKLVSTLPTSMTEAGQRWLQLSGVPVGLRFYRTASLFEELLKAAADRMEPANDEVRESGADIITRLSDVFDRRLVSLLREAWMQRNQVAHHFGSEGDITEDALATVNVAIFELLSQLASCPEPPLSTRVSIPTSIPKTSDLPPEPVDISRLNSSISQVDLGRLPASAGVAVEKAQSLAPLRRLLVFIDTEMNRNQRRNLLEQLDRQRYSGPDNLRMLEFLIRVEDPAEWIANEFSYYILKRAIRARGLNPKTDDRKVLALTLLDVLGFPVGGSFTGIKGVLLELENIRNEMLVSNTANDGCVTRGARLLEYVCHVVIRFLCHAAFDLAPEILLRGDGLLASDQEVRNCTLGKLLEIVDYMVNRIEQDTHTVSVQKFKMGLQRSEPLPRGMQKLAAVRNSFAHYKNETLVSQTTRRDRARSFIEDAVVFARAVNGSDMGLFPIIIRIDSVTVDRWGRKTVVAFRDDGVRETIFTDQALETGRIYFMHPTTNPLRVDPLLVPAGKLWDDA